MEKVRVINRSTTEKTFLKKSFLISGVGFLAIFFIGLIIHFIIDGAGILKEGLDNSKRLNFDMYKEIKFQNALSKLARVSIVGMAFIFISPLLNIVWAFRVLKASKAFIFFTLSFYILGQGIGFGILFVTWKAIDLIAIFGIAGGIFIFMAIIGYYSKNLLPLGKWLIIGSIFSLFLMLFNFILYFAGVYSGTFNLILYSLFGFLVIGWIAFDVWSIKKTSEYAKLVGGFDEMTEFRLVTWSAFKLLSDFVALIWLVAYFYKS